MSPREQELEEQVAYLSRQVRELTGHADAPHYRAEFGMSRQEAEMLALLVSRPGMPQSTGTVYDHVFLHANGDGPEWPAVRVVVYHVRRKLRAAGFKDAIQTLYGNGYWISKSNAAHIRQRAGL
jgi:DNA-binding response OmpR family regulator